MGLAGPLAGTVAAAAVFFGLLLPPGYALARLLRVGCAGVSGLAIATALGYSTVLPLLLAEHALGGPWLVLPAAALSVAWLRPGRAAREGLRRLVPDLVTPLALAGLAILANGGDAVGRPDGLSLGLGFDVSDRVFYAAVAQELRRAPIHAIQNPIFAGLPLQYAFFPSLSGVLIESYTGIPPLALFLVPLPAIALAFVGLAVHGILAENGIERRTIRAATALLVVLGGDLSFLVPEAPARFLERYRHFFVFFSFSGECLFYNPWMFGVPLALVSLFLASRYFQHGRPGDLGAAAVVLGSLWQTKVFGFLGLVGGAVFLGLAWRRSRPLLLASAAAALALPWIVLTTSTGSAREGAPLAPSLLYLIRTTFEQTPSLTVFGRALGVESAMPLRALGIAALTAVVLVGGMGLRVTGLPHLLREARRDPARTHGLLAATVLVTIIAALLLEGNATQIESVQFLLLSQSLLWIPAGPILARIGLEGPPLRRLTGLGLLGLAMVTPVGYVLRKALPERFTADDSIDRQRLRLPTATLEACRWLERASAPTDSVLVPVSGTEDPFGQRPLYVAALSGRRVLASLTPYHLSLARAVQRARAIQRVYQTEDAAEAEALFLGLGARWVWEDATQPLRFRSERLALAHVTGPIRIYRVAAGS